MDDAQSSQFEQLRDAFEIVIDEGDIPDDVPEYNGKPLTPDRVASLLWDCIYIMPSRLCAKLHLPRGSNYAQGVRRMRSLVA